MKKILIFITIILFIAILIFGYKYFSNKDYFNSINNETELDTNGIFLLYIDEIREDNGNLKIYGKISKGTIENNNEITIAGLGMKSIDTKILKIESNNSEVNFAKAGDNVCITIDSNVKADYIKNGQAMIKTGSTKPIFNVDAKIVESNLSIQEIVEKGNQFNINTNIKCSLSIISEEDKMIKIKLEESIITEEGMEVLIKENEEIIAKCIIDK